MELGGSFSSYSSVFKTLKISLVLNTAMNYLHNMSSMGEINYQWNSLDMTEVVSTRSYKKAGLVF